MGVRTCAQQKTHGPKTVGSRRKGMKRPADSEVDWGWTVSAAHEASCETSGAMAGVPTTFSFIRRVPSFAWSVWHGRLLCPIVSFDSSFLSLMSC